MLIRFLSLALAAFLLTSCGGGGADEKAAGPDLIPVKLQLNWWPEAEHGGFYAAQIHGYYEEAGLDVEIIGGGPDVPVETMVASGRMEFGVANADGVLLSRAQEANIVALMAPIQDSPRCIMVHADSGIESFEDLNDITLAMSPKPSFSHFLRDRLELKNVRMVNYAGVAPWLADENYAMQAYSFSEPYVARSQGGNPRVLMVKDLGFNPYTSCLITSDEYITENEDIVRRMTEASARGWVKYFEEPLDTNVHINQVNPEMGMDILNYGFQQILPLSLTDTATENGMGTMTSERWQTLLDQHMELGLIEEDAVNAAEAFTNRYLPQTEAVE